MTKIPDEHSAARELYDAFVAAGRERSGQPALPAEADRSRWRTRRVLIAVPVVLLTLVTGAGAARILLDDGPAVPGEPKVSPNVRREPADAALAAVRAADPYGGLPWGERLYSSATGGRCALIGRVRDGTLGVVRDGRFSALAPDAPGACGRAGARRLIARQESADANPRSVLFGFVDRSVRSIDIVAGAQRTRVPIAPDGSYLVVTKTTVKGTLLLATSSGEIRRNLGP